MGVVIDGGQFSLLDGEPLKKSHFNSFLFLPPRPTRNPAHCLILHLHECFFFFFAIELSSENGEVSGLYPPDPGTKDKILTQCVLPYELRADSMSSLTLSL